LTDQIKEKHPMETKISNETNEGIHGSAGMHDIPKIVKEMGPKIDLEEKIETHPEPMSQVLEVNEVWGNNLWEEIQRMKLENASSHDPPLEEIDFN